MPDSAGTLHLDQIEPLPWRGSDIRWLPVRAALDARICGISAYVSQTAGQTLIEDHVESRDCRGHEEVYVVLEGRATFTLRRRPP